MTHKEWTISGAILALILLLEWLLLDWAWQHGRGDLYAQAFKCVAQTDSILHSQPLPR